MTPADQQRRIIEDLAILPDAFECLNALVARAANAPPLPDGERLEAHRVHGCQSALWIAPETDPAGGVFAFRSFSETPTVAALGALFCEIFSGATAADIMAFEPTVLDELGLARSLTPNRQHGARQIVAKIKAFASSGA